METNRHIAVFCGSALGTDPAFTQKAIELGKVLVQKEVGLVYGGGNRGLMGVIAHTVYENGGNVIGVLPKSMDFDSITKNTAASEIRITDDMHERKKLMYSLSDGFIAMPGGIGTIEELAEIFTWRQLGFHQKNVALYNIGGFWDPLIEQIRKSVELGFIAPEVQNLIMVSEDAEELVERVLSEKIEVSSKLDNFRKETL